MGVRRGEAEAGREVNTAWRLVPPRRDRAERLDLGEGTLQDAAASLDDMWRINRWLGGLRAITTHLYPRLLAQPGSATILDVGTGSAHLAAHIARWAERQQRPVRVLAGDINRRHLSAAQTVTASQPGVQLLQADALTAAVSPQRRRLPDFLSVSASFHA